MKCYDCGKPYMAGLVFKCDGNYIRCKACYDKVISRRESAFTADIDKARAER